MASLKDESDCKNVSYRIKSSIRIAYRGKRWSGWKYVAHLCCLKRIIYVMPSGTIHSVLRVRYLINRENHDCESLAVLGAAYCGGVYTIHVWMLLSVMSKAIPIHSISHEYLPPLICYETPGRVYWNNCIPTELCILSNRLENRTIFWNSMFDSVQRL